MPDVGYKQHGDNPSRLFPSTWPFVSPTSLRLKEGSKVNSSLEGPSKGGWAPIELSGCRESKSRTSS